MKGASAAAGVAALQLTAGGEAGAVDGAIDQGAEGGVAILDEHVGQVGEPDQDAAAQAHAAAVAALASEVDPHARDVLAQPAQREVEPAHEARPGVVVDLDPLPPDVDLHDYPPMSRCRVWGAPTEVSPPHSLLGQADEGK